MQQLKVEHKNEEQEQKRECKGRRLAITGKIYRLQNTENVFYVLSESRSDNTYYLVKYNLSDSYCSCPDSSMKQMKCKHIWSIEYAIMLATVKDVDKLPIEVKKEVTKSYTEDGQYDF
jgi:predicted nucleic acid-binding Zn finger protein